MKLNVQPSGEACGATVRDLDLSQPMSDELVNRIRQAWLQHHVLVFPDQEIDDDDLERFTLAFGPFGDDPFIAPIKGREHIIAVQREADETAPVFAEAWHTDWSFQAVPPAGTCLYGITIPPVGGDTLFCDQHLALREMPADLRSRLEGKQAVHSARLAYSPEGAYGEQDAGRSMDIRASEQANDTRLHPIIREHPETGEPAIYGSAGYVIGFVDMPAEESEQLLMELYNWQTQPQFQYRHKWRPNMLLMWDNRSVLHMATGGYDGHARYLHRTTIGEKC
ncbi:MAG: TauD/TfdA family dioxygenase [Arenicella sp.]|nr:TauD/TfdA family dioxygenase [Arenicella sp.]